MGSAAMYDLSEQIHTNDNAYIAVVIQYRLGAFGYLSSAELARAGVPNAGLHDIYASLLWVQKFIGRFGGDPRQVTISSVSAGAGAAMLMGMANGGEDGSSLFQGIIAASPYLPTQWGYADPQPSESYYRFAYHAGCLTDETAAHGSILDCLVSADTAVLQNASQHVSSTGRYGHWAFTPVTDGTLIRERPSTQLLKDGRINGVRVLSSNHANEGPVFVPRTITSEASFRAWLQKFAAGWQQAAFNLYAEATFVCPSFWLADAYARDDRHQAWHYQYSVSPGLHGDDMGAVAVMPGATAGGTNEVLRTTLQQIWGNFIVDGDPTLRASQFTADEGGDDLAASGKQVWTPWEGKAGKNRMLNINMTGGVAVAASSTIIPGITLATTKYAPGNDSSASPLSAVLEMVEGWTWEGGRGERCRLWANLGEWIMA